MWVYKPKRCYRLSMFALQPKGKQVLDRSVGGYRLSMFALQHCNETHSHAMLGSYRLSMFALQPRNSFNLCLSLRRASVLISSSMSGVVKTA